MVQSFIQNLRTVRYGLILALLTIVYGFGLGIVFGVYEGDIKKYLESSAQFFNEAYKGDTSKIPAMVGAGSLGYSLFWMFAGFSASGMGSTSLAKESLAWLSIPSSAFCVIGLLLILLFTVQTLFQRK